MSILNTYKLKNNNLEVILTNLGASVYQIYFHNKEMLATPKSLTDFIENKQSFGRTVGRTAGRVFKNDETIKYIDFKNEEIIKHGGNNRLGEKYFDVLLHEKNKIVFNLKIDDNQDGFYGDLDLLITYQLNDLNELIIKHEATSSKDSLLRLTFHPYFNLEQSNHLFNHSLQINTDYLLDMDKTGKFTDPISINKKNHNYLNARKLDINDNYNLDDIFVIENLEPCCILSCNDISMSIKSNYDTLVVYTQNSVANHDLTNAKKGEKYASIAIETQNAQNKLPLLKANEKYDYYTIYSFKKNVSQN